MSPFIRRLFFGLYIIIAIIVFGYLLFPAKPIQRYIENHAGMISPGIRVTMDRLSPGFPIALKMSKVDLYRRNTHLLSNVEFTLKPKLGSLFGSSKAYAFGGQLHQGSVNGAFDFKEGPSPQPFNFKSDFKGIDLTTVPGLEPWREQLTSGTLEGRIRYDHRGDQATMGAQLTLRDVTVKLDIPLDKLDHLLFANISADLEANGPKLEIRQCRFSGPQGEGQITGTINLRTPAAASTLNLTGHFKPNPGLIMQLQGTLWGDMLTANKGQADAGYPFRIRGSLNAPQWQLR